VSHFTLRWLSKKCKVAKTLCELATCLGVGPQDHKDRLLFRRRLEHFAQRGELNSVSVGGPWPGVVLIHHMPGWDEWIKVRKEKASQRRTAGVAGRAALGGYLSLESGCTLKDSRVSCLLITLSSPRRRR